MSTGPLGLSAAGLHALKSSKRWPKQRVARLIRAHVRPYPQLAAGRILSGKATMATSCMDLSDDLRTSAEILAQRSGVGIEVDLNLAPVAPELARYCADAGISPYPLIADGGEDYQLLFTVRPERADRVRRALPQACALGRVVPKKRDVQIRLAGKLLKESHVRFRHW